MRPPAGSRVLVYDPTGNDDTGTYYRGEVIAGYESPDDLFRFSFRVHDTKRTFTVTEYILRAGVTWSFEPEPT